MTLPLIKYIRLHSLLVVRSSLLAKWLGERLGLGLRLGLGTGDALLLVLQNVMNSVFVTSVAFYGYQRVGRLPM